MVSGICRRKRKSVSSQGALFRRAGEIPRMAAGYRAASTTFFRNLDVPSAGIGYNLILARPMPPPSVGTASFMRGHYDHRTNCTSTKHKEGM